MTHHRLIQRTTLHFDLRHSGQEHDYQLHSGGQRFDLCRHDDDSLARACTENAGLASLSRERLAHATHYVPDLPLPADSVRLLYVTRKVEGLAINELQPLSLFALHIPADAMETERRAHHKLRSNDPRFAELEIEYPQDLETRLRILDGLDHFKNPRSAAEAVVSMHPQLASLDKQTASHIMNAHIANALGLGGLISAISRQGQTGWAVSTPSVDKNGNQFQWGKQWGDRKGTTVYQYKLTDETLAAAPEPVGHACTTSQDDPTLQNNKWSVYQGRPNHPAHPAKQPGFGSAGGSMVTSSGQTTMVLNNRTPGNGVDFDLKSIAYKAAKNPGDPAAFSIDMSNSFLRILWAWVQYLDQHGNVLTSTGKPAAADYYEEIGIVTAVNTILGIPSPTDPTTLAFPWPEQASSVRIVNAGIGGGDANGDLIWRGIVMTGVFQMVIPMLFLVGGQMIENGAWYKAFVVKGKYNPIDFFIHFVPSGAAGAPSLTNYKSIMSSLGDGIAGYLASDAAEALGMYIAERLAAAEIIESVPVVGTIARIAACLITAAQLSETIIEVAMSPAEYIVEVIRLVALIVTVHPDPTKGTQFVKATWPEAATGGHYLFQVQYKDGTNYSQRGSMPNTTNSDAIVGSFPALPSGGKLQVSFAVYSKDNWLAGKWTSGWLDAVPPGIGVPLTVEGSIIESLAPLTAKTQYEYEESLLWNGTAHVWKAGDRSTAVKRDLNPDTGLGKLSGITINDKAYMLGYTWQAANQNIPRCDGTKQQGQVFVFQNINIGATPQDSLKYPSCSFSGEPGLIYDQFGPAALLTLPLSAVAALDAGTLTDDIRAAFTAVDRALPQDATIKTVTSSAEWNIGWPHQSDPGYVLRRSPAAIEVRAYPDPPFSPRNFYVDPRGSEYHLRQVVLDNSTPFDMSPKLSWGRFNSPHLNAFAIHPAGYAVGANWANHRLEILKLPAQGVPDAQAPLAIMKAGKGLRQGLLSGPVALTVTSDGRILVLETGNKRVQGFDLNGNPAPSFDGAQRATLQAAGIADLDQEHVGVELRRALAAAGVNLTGRWQIANGNDQIQVEVKETLLLIRRNGADLSTTWDVSDSGGTYEYHLEERDGEVFVNVPETAGFRLPADAESALERGAVTPEIVSCFHDHGIEISPQSTVSGNQLSIPRQDAEAALALGKVPPQLVQALATRKIDLNPATAVGDVILVTVSRTGREWIVCDVPVAASYKLTLSGERPQLEVVDYLSYFPLHDAGDRTYLSLSSEMLGYIYVLSYAGQGDKVDDYILDLYEPTGRWLCATSGVNAALLVVNQWRTVYTLDYRSFAGPGGRIEPSVSTWIPSTS